MDSQDSSAPAFTSTHAILMAQHNPIQHHFSNSSYPLPNSTNSAMMHQQNPRFSLNSAAPPKPIDHHYSDGSPSGSGGAWYNIEPAKKKRGRPRKYSPDNSIGLGLSAAPAAQVGDRADSVGGGGDPSPETPNKRHRGRPPGSVKRQLDALGVPGVGFTPHVIVVNSGEDIASKIMDFSQQGPRTVCILSANGAICNVTLRQTATSGGTVTYEGRFEIISLSGSFLLSESNGGRSGALSVSLAGTDGRVLGGGVVGLLTAASPVQVIVGSFIAEGGKKSKGGASPLANLATPVTEATPHALSDSDEENDDDDGSPYGNAVHDVPLYSNMGWPNSMKMHPS